MMTAANTLIQEYNRLDMWLRKAFSIGRDKPFSYVLGFSSKKNRLIRDEQQFILSIADLRNAIVHDKDYPAKIIAEPRLEVVQRFQSICQKLYTPPQLMAGTFEQPDIFLPSDGLSKALPYMKAHDYSQIVVRWPEQFGLITREGVAMWLESNIVEDVISIKDAKLEDIREYESPDTCRYLGRDASYYDAGEHFAQCTGRLQAILVSHSGKPTETTLRIITPWDMMEFFENE
jgi:hypothetical protein